HVYFDLKDAGGLVHVVFFRGAATCQRLGVQNGMEVEVQGRLTVYEVQGRYQVNAVTLRPVGLGEQQRRLEELKLRLQAEGLFNAERKRPLPPFPQRVGVVASKDSAAIGDFLRVLGRRHSGIHILACHATVQGATAPASIAAAIRALNGRCDVIVVTRGGGSKQDLSCFNEEIVARAIVESPVPVISAVGHERDVTIADLAADFRCSTPSAAAEQVVKAKTELEERLNNFSMRLISLVQYRVQGEQSRLDRLLATPSMVTPQYQVDRRMQHWEELDMRLRESVCPKVERLSQSERELRLRLAASLPALSSRANVLLNQLGARLTGALPQRVMQEKGRLELASSRLSRAGAGLLPQAQARHEALRMRLEALSPRGVLSRGYAILLKEDGRAVRASTDVEPGESLRALLASGEIEAEVRKATATKEE
ncbi:MAG: exodeoxyribonuclease VII large subunit, partial [Victivallales bacterium]|nr:exodeoxyribonuclease VII large subunit [Victivallales bacterium]